MDTLKEALCLNNKGVSLLLQGNDREAVSVLGEALGVVKKLLALLGESSVDEHWMVAGSRCSQLNRNQGEIATYHTTFPLPGWYQLPGQNFIYDNVVTIDSDSPFEQEGTVQLFTACIILNLGVAFHRRGHLDRNQKCIEKAEHFYGMISKLLRGISLKNNTAMFLMVTSTNNLSQIHFVNGEISRARQGLQQLSTLFYSAASAYLLFSEREWNGLVLNVLLLNPVIAAAAA